MVQQERVVNEFLELVKIDSESKNERQIADVLKNKLTELGLDVQEDDAGQKVGGSTGNIIAKLKGTNTNAPAIFLSSHMDTVSPGKGVKPVIKDGAIYSSGDTVLGSDDKAGITAILEGLRLIKEQQTPHGDVTIIFSICEEIGLLGAANIDPAKIQAKMGFVLDSSGDAGTIIIKGPTQDIYKIAITGKSAHAGIAPEEGLNAIQVASHAISRLKLGRIDEETTANIGIIQGGKATNIVPDLVNIDGEARSLDPRKLEEQRELIKNTFEDSARKFGAKLTFKVHNEYPIININEDDPVVKVASKATRNVKLEPELVATGGGSDANIYNGKGIPTVNMGVGMEKVHTTEEYITIDNLVQNAELAYQIIKTAGEG